MADISTLLKRILSARFGEDVRQAIHDAIAHFSKKYDDFESHADQMLENFEQVIAEEIATTDVGDLKVRTAALEQRADSVEERIRISESVEFDEIVEGKYYTPAPREVEKNGAKYGAVTDIKAGEIYAFLCAYDNSVRPYILCDSQGIVKRYGDLAPSTTRVVHDYEELSILDDEDGGTLYINTLNTSKFKIRRAEYFSKTKNGMWETGGITAANGSENPAYIDGVYARIRTVDYLPAETKRIYADRELKFFLCVYDAAGVYQGTWDGSGLVTSAAYLKYADLEDVGPYKIRVVAARTGEDAEITTDYSKYIHFTNSDEDNISIIKALKYPIPKTAAEVYDLYDELVTAGYATRNILGEVDGQPIYEYVFECDKKYMAGSNGPITEGVAFERPCIGIISGVHGNEKASVMFAYDFIRRICTDGDFAKYRSVFSFRIVPVACPWGLDNNSRTNKAGINLNRDAIERAAAETPYILNWMSGHSFAFWLDAHQAETGKTGDNRLLYLTMPNPVTTSKRLFLGTHYISAATKVQTAFDALYLSDEVPEQIAFIWNGDDYASYRNYAQENIQGIDYAVSCESSKQCYWYSKSSNDYNSVANNLGNTMLSAYLENIMDALMAKM